MRHIPLALFSALLFTLPAGAVGQVIRLSGGFDFAGALGEPTSAAGYAPASGLAATRSTGPSRFPISISLAFQPLHGADILSERRARD